MAFIKGHYCTSSFARKYKKNLRKSTSPAETTPVVSNTIASSVKDLSILDRCLLQDRIFYHTSRAHDGDRKPQVLAKAARRHHNHKQDNYFEDFSSTQDF